MEAEINPVEKVETSPVLIPRQCFKSFSTSFAFHVPFNATLKVKLVGCSQTLRGRPGNMGGSL